MIEQEEKMQSDNKETLHLTRSRAPSNRVPILRQSPLDVKNREGYRREWIFPSDWDKYEMAGYNQVTEVQALSKRAQDASQMGSVVEKVVNWKIDTPENKKTNILVEIPEEYYLEDLKALHNENYKTLASVDPNKRLIPGSDFGTAVDDFGNPYNFKK